MSSLQQVISQFSGAGVRGAATLPEVRLTQSDTWLTDGYSAANDSGVRVSQETALTLSAFYRGVTLLAGSIATQPKHLFEIIGEDRKNKRIDRGHPAYRLLRKRPNGYQNAFQFQFYMVVVMLLWGNFYALISRNGFGDIVALHPIAPWIVRPEVVNGKKIYWVNGKQYTDDQIFHIYRLSLDGVNGIDPIRYMAQNMGVSLAAQKFQSSVFGRGLHAGGVMTMPEGEGVDMFRGSTDEEAEQYMQGVRESFRKAYQSGPQSWHNLMFLEPGWKFEQFKLNLETAQLIETRKIGVADIARQLGVPLHKLMQLEKATYNNIEQQNIEYQMDGVMPITANIEAEVDAKLLREDERDTHFFKYNLDGIARADLKSRYEAHSIALGKNAPGWMSPEEVREKEDLGDIDPSKLYKPDNMNKQNITPEEAA